MFFCGAGVSLGAGLPTFRGLVDQVYERTHQDLQGGEFKAYRSGAYDRVFELLERRIPSDQIRPAVREALTAAEDAPLDAHRNLLTLARSREGTFRLITTNFDDLFARAARETEAQLRPYEAPLLPVPRTGWHGVVHLHGALSDNSALEDLVLSSSDFGRAYLTEAWASRFLSHLFREFSVAFVGYGVNDPAVRYLMDALASQRARGESFQPAWVFAGIRGGTKAAADRQSWEELGVKLITYNKGYRHRRLYQTLKQWAYLHQGGLDSRAQWAASKVSTPPTSALEDDARMVFWALSEPTGRVARVWSEAHPRCEKDELPSPQDSQAALDWLALFDGSKEGGALTSPLTGYSSGEEHLPKPSSYLARWLARFLAEEGFLQWLVDKHCVIHPEFAGLLREELRRRPDIQGWKRRFLQTVSSSTYQDALRQTIGADRRNDEIDQFIEKLEVARLLRVVPRFKWASEIWAELDPRPRPSIEPYLSFAVRTWPDHEIDRLWESEGLAGHATSLTKLLEDAADWLTYLQPSDQSQAYLLWRDIRSISTHPDVHERRDSWTRLIRLAARAMSGLLDITLVQNDFRVKTLF